MQIIDVSGMVFWQERLTMIPSKAIQRKIAIQDWPSGIYTFQLQQGQESYSETVSIIQD